LIVKFVAPHPFAYPEIAFSLRLMLNVIPSQPENAEELIVVIVFGRLTVTKLVQFRNALALIVLSTGLDSEEGVKVVILLHPSKAFALIVVTLGGNIKLTNPTQPLKQPVPIDVHNGAVIEVRLAQPSNI
jgi:hypothetical protein